MAKSSAEQPKEKLSRNRKSFHRLWWGALWGAWRERRALGEARTFCLFVGYPRSGSSLIGSLVDAHPRAIVAHELDAIRFFQHKFGPRIISYMLLRNSRMNAERGRQATGYSYVVPRQWQGRFERIDVIGDKKAGGTSNRLRRKPELVDRLLEAYGDSLRFVHVMRNPFDNIGTLSKRMPVPLDEAVERYFRMCEGVAEAKRRAKPSQLLDVRFEEFISDPEAGLRRLCAFLGLATESGYLSDCASIVRREPNKTRTAAGWDKDTIARMRERMESFPFLEGYTFEN